MANENWMEEARESGWLDPGEAELLITALKEHDSWMKFIYPPDIFVGLPNCDEGTAKVVRLRNLAEKALVEVGEL